MNEVIDIRRDKPAVLADKILERLRAGTVYRKDLIYRGIRVDDKGLASVRKYGTEKRVVGALRRALMRGLARKRGERADTYDPNVIWAFPEQRLNYCLDKALETSVWPTPMILVYRSDALVKDFPGSDLDEYRARYSFRKGQTPQTAFIGAFRIN